MDGHIIVYIECKLFSMILLNVSIGFIVVACWVALCPGMVMSSIIIQVPGRESPFGTVVAGQWGRGYGDYLPYLSS